MCPPMKNAYDVVIVGAGIVGSAAAYFLKKQGFTGSIALIERDTSYKTGCTALSVGGIRQQFSTPENIALSLFGLKTVRNLKQEFGPEADVGFKEQGYLILASEAGVPILEENHAVQKKHGADNVLLKPDALGERFSWLTTEGLALGCFGRSGEGWMDPYSMMALFRKAAIAQGVELINDEVTGVSREGNRIAGLTFRSGQTLSCGTLVNAAGWGAGALAGFAGIELPVGPRKRYVYVLDCPAATEALHKAPLTVQPSGVWFRPEGRNFICGISPEEHEEPTVFDWEIDYSMWEDRVWPGVAEHVPLFEAVKVISAWAGFYDYNSLDQNGIIGRHPEVSNFIFANGFSGHGFQQGPASGNAVAELIVHGGFRTIDLTRFGYERVRNNAPLFEKNVI
jgi:FAD-dependent oxidoreductase domain-containing protein 1